MNFLYPAFLFALLSLAVPIIIHLFNFRKYKKIYFTNVRFLKELKQESESKSKLKNYLILASRLLALTCLVLAFSQPYLPNKNANLKKGQKAISVFLDNSFSMEGLSKNGMLFENAKNRAREIAKAFSDADKFQLLTNDFEGKHQRLVSKEEFMQAIDECKISSSFKTIAEIYSRQKDLLNSSGANDKRIYIISDYQKTSCDFEKIKEDTSVLSYFIPLQSNNTGNVYIDTCWFDSPVQQIGMTQKLNVVVVNNSQNNLENASLKLFSNEKLITPATFNVEPNSKVEVEISFLLKEQGIQNCKLELEDHPITFDDKLFFSFNVKNSIPSLLIKGTDAKSGDYFASLMKNDSLFSYSECTDKNIEYSKFGNTDFIVLSSLKTISSGLAAELKKFTTNGGSLFILPALNADIVSYNSLFASLGMNQIVKLDTVNTKADKINYEQGLYDGVFEKKQENIDLPKVYEYYQQSAGIRSNEDVVIRLLNGNAYLSQYSSSNGSKIYFCSAPLEDEASNFGKHALFVPTVIRMAINSSIVRPLYYKSGLNEMISIKDNGMNSEKMIHIKSKADASDIIPEMRKEPGLVNLFTQGQIKLAGNYTISYDGKELEGVSINYERRESDLTSLSNEELDKEIVESGIKSFSTIAIGEKSLTNSIVQVAEGTKLWKLFLILGIVFILIEILLIRLLK